MARAFVTLFLLLLPHLAFPDSGPRLVGARATAMAGAFTAVADDTTSFHWNPAGIVHGNLLRAGFYAGSGFEDRNQLVDRLRSESPGEESVLAGGPAWGFSTSFTALGVAVSRFTDTDTFLEDTTLSSRGLETLDVAVTLVQSLPVDVLTVGANAHVIRGTAYEQERPASQVPESQRNVSDLIEAATSSEGLKKTEFALDAGVLYQPRHWVRLGLMVHNLVEPSFPTESGNAIVSDRHARAGVAFRKDPGWLVAVDFDLTSRNSGAPGVAPTWREISLGGEKVWGDRRVALRGGVRTEVADGGMRRAAFTAGAGVRIAMVSVDVGAITSTKRRRGGVWLGVTLTR